MDRALAVLCAVLALPRLSAQDYVAHPQSIGLRVRVVAIRGERLDVAIAGGPGAHYGAGSLEFRSHSPVGPSLFTQPCVLAPGRETRILLPLKSIDLRTAVFVAFIAAGKGVPLQWDGPLSQAASETELDLDAVLADARTGAPADGVESWNALMDDSASKHAGWERSVAADADTRRKFVQGVLQDMSRNIAKGVVHVRVEGDWILFGPGSVETFEVHHLGKDADASSPAYLPETRTSSGTLTLMPGFGGEMAGKYRYYVRFGRGASAQSCTGVFTVPPGAGGYLIRLDSQCRDAGSRPF